VVALRSALGGGEPPQYAHLPLIVDAATRAKLSKRHGAVALEDFRRQGYLPEALLNYTALLGWAPPQDTDEVLTRDDLVALFELADVTHAPAGFDRQKLDWLSGHWIRRLALDDLVARVEPAARDRFADRFDAGVFAGAVAAAQERAITLVEMLNQMGFLFVDEDEFEIAPESWEVVTRTERIADVLDAVIAHVDACEWTPEALALQEVVGALGIKFRKVAPAVYAVIEGVHRGLPLFDSMYLLGRERTLHRLRRGRSRLT
jgi:glutamyl-tRNA synthetase